MRQKTMYEFMLAACEAELNDAEPGLLTPATARIKAMLEALSGPEREALSAVAASAADAITHQRGERA